MILDEKYVLHIPLAKFEDGKISAVNIDGILDELIESLNSRDVNSYYILHADGFYKSRKFPQLLLKVFAPSDVDIGEIFACWFLKNNHVLCQETFAYEKSGKMIVKVIE